MRLHLAVAALLIPLTATVSAQQSVDLREQYHTPSLEAAQHIHRGMTLYRQNHPDQAIEEFDAALKLDPTCQMTSYWRGLTFFHLGEMDKGIDAIKKSIDLAVPESVGLTMNGEIDLALQLAQIKRYDESNYWFSRAIVEKAPDAKTLRAKAYRNMALNQMQRGRGLSAAMEATIGRSFDPKYVTEATINACLEKAGDEETVNLLYLDTELPKVPSVGEGHTLEQIDARGERVDRAITQLLPDPQGRYIIAIAADGDFYYYIETAGIAPVVKTVKLPGPIIAACLAGEELYAIAKSQARLLKVAPDSGAVRRTYTLDPHRPTTVAAFPSKSIAFLTDGDRIVSLNLGTGVVTSTEEAGQTVTASPDEKYLFTRLKNVTPRDGGMRQVFINGRPFIVQTMRQFDWTQTILFKFYVSPDQGALIPAQVHFNAASNGYDVCVSPDGNWVTLAGGGGWRPAFHPQDGGYVIPIFAANDIDHVQTKIQTDAYPLACAVNPVTCQIAALREQDVTLGHLADSKIDKLGGSFLGVTTWSGNGRFLAVATKPSGIRFWKTSLSEHEKTLAATWWKASVVATAKAAATAPSILKSNDALKTFQPSNDDAAVRKSLNAALATGSTERPPSWREARDYAADRETLDSEKPEEHATPGVRIYQFNQTLQKHPQSTPAKFLLAEALRESGQSARAARMHLEVVHADCGRTELTTLSLYGLAAQSAEADKPVAAVSCLAAALYIDRASPATRDLLLPLLAKLKWTQEASALRAAPQAGSPDHDALRTSDPGSGANAQTTNLPALPKLAPATAPLSAAQVFERSARSVVLIQTDLGTGTGVCVADGLIVTSLHVVAASDIINVTTFVVQRGKAVRAARYRGKLVASDDANDLAVLRVNAGVGQFHPVAVAQRAPENGAKVFAIGNPAAGQQVLELSISDGIVSSNERVIDGVKYLQHSAPVNPGNSGGPLLNDRGEVVGIVSLKASLENVSFATLSASVRALFRQE